MVESRGGHQRQIRNPGTLLDFIATCLNFIWDVDCIAKASYVLATYEGSFKTEFPGQVFSVNLTIRVCMECTGETETVIHTFLDRQSGLENDIHLVWMVFNRESGMSHLEQVLSQASKMDSEIKWKITLGIIYASIWCIWNLERAKWEKI
ncbi:hypothetical protein M8C21_003352 [Ambrosia artemisiifolia]|uniref:Uncharacterized protein n=1 Tax=Ambrosia artemisiifolia TaxID=4212 RepID=A0AAD5BRJ9_AMBAR|nr:hypothetical protein M8C21_003352 [Ambrosia artemisiifolia]